MDAISSKNVRAHSSVGGFDKGVTRDQTETSKHNHLNVPCRDVVHSTRYLVPHPPLATSRTAETTTTEFLGWILVTSVPIQQNLKSLSFLISLSLSLCHWGEKTNFSRKYSRMVLIVILDTVVLFCSVLLFYNYNSESSNPQVIRSSSSSFGLR